MIAGYGSRFNQIVDIYIAQVRTSIAPLTDVERANARYKTLFD